MPAPVPPPSLTAVVRKALAGLRMRFSARRPAAEAPEPQDVEPESQHGAPEQQHGEPGRQRVQPAGPSTISQSGRVTNQMSGNAHKVSQVGDIHGNVRF